MKPQIKNVIGLREKPSVIAIQILGPLSTLALAVAYFHSSSLFWLVFYLLLILISLANLAFEIWIELNGRIQLYPDRIVVRWSLFKKDVFQKAEIEHVLATKSFFHLQVAGKNPEIRHKNLRKKDRNLLIEQLMIWEIPMSCKTFRN